MNQPSYTSGRQDVALLATTVGDAFDATVAHHAEREALVVRHQRLRYSWRQLAERVDTYARAFIALGLRPGDRVLDMGCGAGRHAFEMYRLHGVPQKDIAKELGVSPTLVNFMIRDALVHCRKVTAERQGDNLTNLSARR